MQNDIYHQIIDVTEEGILLKNRKRTIFIGFATCAKNFSIEECKVSSKCVATRDISTLSFTFYSDPKTVVIFKKRSFINLIMGKSPVEEFINLENAIINAGYTSYDLS